MSWLKQKVIGWFLPSEAEAGKLVSQYAGSFLRAKLQVFAGILVGTFAIPQAQADQFVTSTHAIAIAALSYGVSLLWSFAQKKAASVQQ